MSEIDAVLSYHVNPATCGVARFNQQLARRLGLPMAAIRPDTVGLFKHPLVSIKPSEIDPVLWSWFPFPSCPKYDLLLHDRDDHSDALMRLATTVYHASDLGCPNLIEGDGSRGQIHVVTLGMAHKIHLAPYEQLKQLLDAAGRPYTIGVSTAVHERAPWDGIGMVVESMRTVFGPRVRSLGYLGDDALVREFYDASAVAVFFDPAARANNTTLWTALTYGQMVITNLDEQSPKELQHGVNVWNLADLREWPDDAALRREMRHRSRAVLDKYSWRSIVDALRVPVHA